MFGVRNEGIVLMPLQLSLEEVIILPGHQLLLKNISSQKFSAILEFLGEHRAARLSYSNGWLEIMVPLPEHEKAKEIISEMVKILLEELYQEYESLGSTTFKNEKMTQAVEPDACFYIQNCNAIIGKNRIDLTIDPPPDLAIEIDLTSRTQLNNYQLLGIPELWRYRQGKLEINILKDNQYVRVNFSPNFPKLPLTEIIPECIRRNQTQVQSAILREFRDRIQKTIIANH